MLIPVTISEGVTNIEYGAFSGCSSLTSITIPEGVTSIGKDAFYGCSSLMSVTIPDSVTSIGEYAFRDCSSLTILTIPKGVTSIGREAFRDCSSLRSVTISEGVTSIEYGAFSGCSSLTSITIPEGVTSIEYGAFQDCSSLMSVTIPDSVTYISTNAFLGCPAILKAGSCGNSVCWWLDADRTLTISGSGAMWDYTVTDANKPDWRGDNSKILVIGKGVTSIGQYAFDDCYRISSVTIPESLTSVNVGAFNLCDSLTDVNYYGSQEAWQEIFIDIRNEPLENAIVHFNQGSGGANLGDVNGDNTVDAKDLTALARHVARIETITDATRLKNADVDGVNGITAADLTKLARYVAKIISEL